MLRTLLLGGTAAMFILAACATPQGALPTAPGAATEQAPSDAMSSAGIAASDPMAEGAMTEDPMAEGDMTGDPMAEGVMTEGDMTESHAMAEGAMTEGDMTESHAMAEGAMTEEAMAESHAMAGMVELPAWAAISLTDAHTGASFTLADFAGKTVFVEPMATWCTNCRSQLNNVKAAKAQLGDGDVVFVALSVETTLEPSALAGYADEHGFDWVFAVATPDLLQQLAGDFGQTIANPPATPHFVIGPDGAVSELSTGIESAEAILAKVQG